MDASRNWHSVTENLNQSIEMLQRCSALLVPNARHADIFSAKSLEMLEAALTRFHARHESDYGPKRQCTHPACVEAKLGIALLEPYVIGANGREHQ